MKRPCIAILLLLIHIGSADASELVDFINGIWNHGGGPTTGWDSNELSGSYTMGDGNSVTMTVSFAGSAVATSGNLDVITKTFFTGFAFQMDPASNQNTGSNFDNYERIDLVFAAPVVIEEFIITDVDRSGWDDVIFAEAWGTGGVGTLGTGTTANYGFRETTNVGIETHFGLQHAVVLSGENTTNGSESDLFLEFDDPLTALSFFYWNGDYGSSDNTQTIGLQGSGFTVSTVPEIPEPSTAFSLLLGIACLGWRRKTRR